MPDKWIRSLRSNIPLNAAVSGTICTIVIGWLRYAEGLPLEWWLLALSFAIFTGGWYWVLWVRRRLQ